MNIILVNTLYYPYKIGGAEVSVQILAESLIEKGHSVTVVSIHEHNERKDTEHNGVKIIYLPYSNIYWGLSLTKRNPLSKILWHLIDLYNFKIAKEFENIIMDVKPDIVHTNNLSGISCAVWQKAKKYKCRVIHTSRDYYLIHPNCKLYKNGSEMSVKSIAVSLWSLSKKYWVKMSMFM
ncbi:glycosyltransferase [Klebsiella pneumoniae]|uniref:glycosyltransferase n=1 Tax=Klebsiella pneumoniae TaxID=573 RepID=UPI00388D0791